MKKIIITLTLAITLISQASLAQLNCQDVLGTKPPVEKLVPIETTRITLIESQLIQEKMTQKNPLFEKALKQLIQMFANTVFLNISEKASFEKGEIFLAHKINEDMSLELEYSGDKRGADPVFRLINYKIIQKNLKSSIQEKNPVIEDGTQLNQKLIELKRNLKEGELDLLKELELEIPVAISADLLRVMEKWSDKLNLINRKDLRDLVEKDEMFKLYLKAQYLSGIEFSKNIIKKQSYKYVLIGLVIYASSYAMENFISNKIDQVVSELQNSIKMSADDNKLFQTFFTKMDMGWKLSNTNLSVDLQKLTTVLSKKDKITSIESFRTTLANMTTQEYTLDGSPSFYVMNPEMNKISELQDEQMIDLDFEVKLHRYLVSVYPKTQSLQISIVNLNDKSKLNSIASLAVYRSKNPTIYEAILKNIQDLKTVNPP